MPGETSIFLHGWFWGETAVQQWDRLLVCHNRGRFFVWLASELTSCDALFLADNPCD
jgi:hypothetical protein